MKEIKEIFVRLNDAEGVTLSVAAGRNDLQDNKIIGGTFLTTGTVPIVRLK